MPRVNGTKLFIICLSLFVLIVPVHNYIRYYIYRDYDLHVFSQCNPLEHNCFLADSESADPTFQNGPYIKVSLNASVAPTCLDEHTCTDFSCANIRGRCEITYCKQALLDGGETCTNNSPQ